MALTVANLEKALGVRSTRVADRYWREPPPLHWWVKLDPLSRLLIIAVWVGALIALAATVYGA